MHVVRPLGLYKLCGGAFGSHSVSQYRYSTVLYLTLLCVLYCTVSRFPRPKTPPGTC